MALIETKWTKGDFIPRSGLIAWHSADTTDTVTELKDSSGTGRDMKDQVAPLPTLTPNIINGLPGVSFDGVDDNPLIYTGNVTPYHVFVIAAHADASFPAGEPGNAGLLTGVTSGDILVGNASSTRFFDFDFESLGTYKFRRRDVLFAENDLQAAFSNAISIFEVSLSSGWTLDGIQVGRQRAFAGRRWKGYWLEQLLYSRVLTDTERQQIYEYIAMKYLLWRRVASGLDVWPFQPEWQRSLTTDKLVLRSGSVSGAVKARSKSAAKKGFEASFENRRAEEYDAAQAFWNSKYPGTSFIYRDDAFSPSRDTEALFTSSLPQQATSYHDISYGLQALEV